MGSHSSRLHALGSFRACKPLQCKAFESATAAVTKDTPFPATSDLDAENSVIRVQHQLGRDGTRATLKAEESRRSIDIPPRLMRRLVALTRERGAHDDPEAFVFANRNGSGIERKVACEALKRAVKEARIAAPPPTLHDLRHSHASMLIALDVSVVEVQRRLGHRKPDTTLTHLRARVEVPRSAPQPGRTPTRRPLRHSPTAHNHEAQATRAPTRLKRCLTSTGSTISATRCAASTARPAGRSGKWPESKRQRHARTHGIRAHAAHGLKGKTPEATISAMLAVGSKPAGPFARVDKGTYTLAKTRSATTKPAQQKPAAAARRQPARKQTAARKKPTTAKSPRTKRSR